MPLPDPGEDDGHLISHLVLGQVAEEIEHQYSREQAVVFPEESGIDLDRIPAPANSQPQGRCRCSERTRTVGRIGQPSVLRGFLSRFLTGQLRLGLPALPPGHRALTDSGSGYFRGLHWRRLKHDGHLFDMAAIS